MRKPVTLISTSEAENWMWSESKPFRGEIPGFMYEVCVQLQKADGTITYSSSTFTNDIDYIILDEITGDFNDLGIAYDSCAWCGGYTATGKVVFRGYVTPEWNWEYREEVYRDADEEVNALWSKYVIGVDE